LRETQFNQADENVKRKEGVSKSRYTLFFSGT
jgi:hypothetical protein